MTGSCSLRLETPEVLIDECPPWTFGLALCVEHLLGLDCIFLLQNYIGQITVACLLHPNLLGHPPMLGTNVKVKATSLVSL